MRNECFVCQSDMVITVLSDMVGQVGQNTTYFYNYITQPVRRLVKRLLGMLSLFSSFVTSVTRSYEGKLASCLAISYTVQCSKSLKVSVFHSYFGSTENRERSSPAQPSLLDL